MKINVLSVMIRVLISIGRESIIGQYGKMLAIPVNVKREEGVRMSEGCEFDSIIMAICPHCHEYMEVCKETKTYCQKCDFSFHGKDPCKGCENDVPGWDMCKVGGFKKIREAKQE